MLRFCYIVSMKRGNYKFDFFELDLLSSKIGERLVQAFNPYQEGERSTRYSVKRNWCQVQRLADKKWNLWNGRRLIFPEWYDSLTTNYGFATVYKEDKCNFCLYETGRLVLNVWAEHPGHSIAFTYKRKRRSDKGKNNSPFPVLAYFPDSYHHRVVGYDWKRGEKIIDCAGDDLRNLGGAYLVYHWDQKKRDEGMYEANRWSFIGLDGTVLAEFGTEERGKAEWVYEYYNKEWEI